MKVVYDLIQENPKFFAWTFGLINVLWGGFVYFNKQSHEKAMENLKHSLILKQGEALPLIKKLSYLEELAGEAKEIGTSYRTLDQKKKLIFPILERLDQFAGQLSKHPQLMQAIRDLSQLSGIMVQDGTDKSCREDVLNSYKTLIQEAENVKCEIKV